jgi:hypothetical protein
VLENGKTGAGPERKTKRKAKKPAARS